MSVSFFKLRYISNPLSKLPDPLEQNDVTLAHLKRKMWYNDLWECLSLESNLSLDVKLLSNQQESKDKS